MIPGTTTAENFKRWSQHDDAAARPAKRVRNGAPGRERDLSLAGNDKREASPPDDLSLGPALEDGTALVSAAMRLSSTLYATDGATPPEEVLEAFAPTAAGATDADKTAARCARAGHALHISEMRSCEKQAEAVMQIGIARHVYSQAEGHHIETSDGRDMYRTRKKDVESAAHPIPHTFAMLCKLRHVHNFYSVLLHKESGDAAKACGVLARLLMNRSLDKLRSYSAEKFVKAVQKMTPVQWNAWCVERGGVSIESCMLAQD